LEAIVIYFELITTFVWRNLEKLRNSHREYITLEMPQHLICVTIWTTKNMEAEALSNRCYQRTSLHGIIPAITAIFSSTPSLNVANSRVMCVRETGLWR
jgi:hypothetical protein